MRMRFQCPQCGAKYKIDAAKLPATGATLRCKRCRSRFSVTDAPPAPKPAIPGREAAFKSFPKPVNSTTTSGNLITEFIAAGNLDGAAQLLFDQIKQRAREKNFGQAEILLDRLYQVAPMALNEIVSANEIIEQEKSKSIDPDHLGRWAELYQSLESEESSELYCALKTRKVKAGQPVYQHGARDAHLYFVHSGSLNMYYHDETKRENIVIKELFPGDVANADAFFSFTLCTCALVATKDALLGYLSQSILDKWQEKYPGLEPKLAGFCRRRLDMKALIEKAGIDLRAHPRYPVQFKAVVELFDAAGNPDKNTLRVDCYDISAGGASFGLKLQRRTDAARLLGRHIILKTAYRIGPESRSIRSPGKIVAAHLQPFGESSIHVRFDRLLTEATVADIELLASRGAA